MSKRKIGITGNKGFVGSHLYNFLQWKEEFELIDFGRQYFEDSSLLENFVASCDIIIHLAALNRHEDQQVIYDTNIDLVSKLINACKKSSSKPWILMSSSTQEKKDNLYGRSKKEGGLLLEKWAAEYDGKYSSLVIPNVFGPFGKPFYNSVFATFCTQVINGEEPTIIQDGNLQLIYVNELCEEFYNAIVEDKEGKVEVPYRHELKVSELLSKLKSYKELYLDNGKFPAISNPTDLAMFNSFRCYIPHSYYPRPFTKHTDPRGSFVEIVRADSEGQFSFSTTVPGITRGNHFHTRKAERFAVIKGKASIKLRKINTEEVIDYIIDGNEPAYVDMPIWYTHNITNIGDEELITLFWINEPYNPEDADTYFINV